MQLGQFSNMLIVILLVLQLVNYFVLFYALRKNQILLSACILLIINRVFIYALKKIRVTNKHGKIQNLADIIVNVIAVGIILFISSILFLIAGIVYAKKKEEINGKGNTLYIPVIATAIIYGSLVVGIKIF